MANWSIPTRTLLIGACGGALFAALSFPAAFLTGSAVAVTLATTAGRMKADVPGPLRNATFAVLGAMMGAGITPEAFHDLQRFPIALVGLGVVIVGATASSYVVLRKVGRWDRLSALLGSVPGHFSLVVVVADETGARMERVVMAQAFRLVLLVTLIPFVLGGDDASVVRAIGPADATWADVVLTIAIAIAAAFVAKQLRFPAPSLMGPLVASTVLSGTGLVTMAVPTPLSAVAFMVLGASVGMRFSNVRPDNLPRMLAASLASFTVAVGVALALAVGVAHILNEPLGAMFLAYAPGGLDAMIALTFILGFDIAFVATLHTARMIILALTVPLVIVYVRRSSPGGDDAGEPSKPAR